MALLDGQFKYKKKSWEIVRGIKKSSNPKINIERKIKKNILVKSSKNIWANKCIIKVFKVF